VWWSHLLGWSVIQLSQTDTIVQTDDLYVEMFNSDPCMSFCLEFQVDARGYLLICDTSQVTTLQQQTLCFLYMMFFSINSCALKALSSVMCLNITKMWSKTPVHVRVLNSRVSLQLLVLVAKSVCFILCLIVIACELPLLFSCFAYQTWRKWYQAINASF